VNAKAKTHYRKAFNSPYLSSADIVEPTQLTIANVKLEKDQTHKSKEVFNTAHFTAKELRPDEPLKPMILNATNSKMLKAITGSPYIDDWNDITVTVWVDSAVRFGRDTVEGLRIGLCDPVITDHQVVQLNEQIEALEIDLPKFLAFLGTVSIEALPVSKLNTALNAIKRKTKQAGKE
jgi:hypothetical protein